MALNITVHSMEGERYAHVIEAGRHKLTADKPASRGGADMGPGPYSYLLAALGTWAAITLRMYAERKNISLSDVRIKLTHHRKDPAQDKGGKTILERIDGIEGVIQLEGDLDEAQRKRMIEIAGRCMMHRTLSAGVDIRFHSPEE